MTIAEISIATGAEFNLTFPGEGVTKKVKVHENREKSLRIETKIGQLWIPHAALEATEDKKGLQYKRWFSVKDCGSNEYAALYMLNKK